MTTPVKSKRFRLRKDRPATPEAPDAADSPAEPPAPQPDTPAPDDSVPLSRRARVSLRKKRKGPDAAPEAPAPGPAAPDTPPPARDAAATTDPDAIKAEGLTARQLRMAMRVAQKHGIRVASAHEAVAALRQRGIDPFARATMLELVRDNDTSRALTKAPQTAPANASPPASPSDARIAKMTADRERELRKMQRDIAKRRRRKLLWLGVRILVFVTFPTFLATMYFYHVATPMYATETEFVIQKADSGSGGAGDLASMMPSAGGMGMGGQQDAASVQSFLQSRGAMLRLTEEEGFKDHFSQPKLDFFRQLAPDATDEAAFDSYQRHVQIGYDPTEGVVRMEVIAASPEASERFARALVSYAEDHVDRMTQRMRESQMTEARRGLREAQQALIAARQDVVALQEQTSVISGEVEVQMLAQQLGTLESQLTETQLRLQEMRSNAQPNPARLRPLERREQALRAEIADLRDRMTAGQGGDESLAQTRSRLISAEAEVQTREMMRAQAMQQLEAARMDVSRQLRYLALTVEPIAPDEPTYPRKLANSSLAFLIFAGIYLFASMTGSVLREQVSG